MAFTDDPFEELERMKKRLDFLMRRMWEPVQEEINNFGSGFPVDISETEDDIIIKADLPGFSKDEVSAKLTENTVEIAAQHKEKKVEKNEKVFRAERRYGSFKRFLTLPAAVNTSKIDAKFENGLLIIKAPKREKKKTGKEIQIK
jgi:HSP20 family protein